MRTFISAIGVLVVGLLAAACSGASGDVESSGEESSGLRATLQQATAFQNQRALQLGLRYEGDQEVQVGAIQLSSPLFAPVEAQQRDFRVRPGGSGTIMPLSYGEARCDEEPGDAPAELVTDVDGEEVRVPITELPDGLLAALHADDCAATGILDAVELRLADGWEHTAERTAQGPLEIVQREEGVTAAVEKVEGNVILTVQNGDEQPQPWVEVSDDEPSASAEVVIFAARCDPHAIIEYKRTYWFPVTVRLGDQDPVRVEIKADGDAHAALEQAIADCR